MKNAGDNFMKNAGDNFMKNAGDNFMKNAGDNFMKNAGDNFMKNVVRRKVYRKVVEKYVDGFLCEESNQRMPGKVVLLSLREFELSLSQTSSNRCSSNHSKKQH